MAEPQMKTLLLQTLYTNHVGKRTAAMLVVSTLANVAPEVDLGEGTLYSPSQKKANKAEPTLALKSRGDVT